MTRIEAIPRNGTLVLAGSVALFAAVFPFRPGMAQMYTQVPAGVTAPSLPSAAAAVPNPQPPAGSQPSAPAVTPAQGCGSDCGSPNYAGGGGGSGSGGISKDRTDRIIGEIAKAQKTCSDDFVERRYRIDCLRWELKRIASQIPDTGDYAPVRRALAKASRDLEAIAVRYADPAAPGIQPHVGGKPLATQTPPLIGVRRADEERAIREAERVIDEAQTILLRSSSQSQTRQVAYQEIATALDSTKVLLRSS